MSPGHALKALESLGCRKAFFAFIKYLTRIQSSVIQSQFLFFGRWFTLLCEYDQLEFSKGGRVRPSARVSRSAHVI